MNSVLGNKFLLIINIINTEIIKCILICVSYEKADTLNVYTDFIKIYTQLMRCDK
jgi:hypothetical protein